MAWDFFDFAVFGALLAGIAVVYGLAVGRTTSTSYRYAVGVALVAAFLLVWVNGAVGIIGDESNDANLMFLAVPVVAVIGAVLARFRPPGTARALYATALAQALVAVIALAAGLGSTDPTWPAGLLILTGFFAALWLASARLFQKAASAPTRWP